MKQNIFFFFIVVLLLLSANAQVDEAQGANANGHLGGNVEPIPEKLGEFMFGGQKVRKLLKIVWNNISRCHVLNALALLAHPLAYQQQHHKKKDEE